MTDIHEIKKMEQRMLCLYNKEAIEAAIDKVAEQMNNQLAGKVPLFLCVMNGAVVFMGQLMTRLNFLLQIDYIHVTRYRGKTSGGELHWIAKPTISLANRTVILVEDILDEGLTLSAVKDYCVKSNAKEILCAALIDKDRPRMTSDVKSCEFTGLKVEDKFLVGYGLDYEGYFRNLPGIYAVI